MHRVHRRHRRPCRARRLRFWTLVIVAAVAVVAVVVVAARPVHAGGPVAAPPPPASLEEVIDRLRTYLVGLLAAVATLFTTVGGVRYLMAGSDPTEVAKAKSALKFGALGYAVAALAPMLVGILKSIVGGP